MLQIPLADSNLQFHAPVSLTGFGADVRNRRGFANRSAKFLLLLGTFRGSEKIGHAAESRYLDWFAFNRSIDDGFRLAPE